MKTNVNTDPRDYVAEASEFTGKTSKKRFLLGLFSLRRMRFDPSTLSSQPSTASIEIIRRRGFFGYKKR